MIPKTAIKFKVMPAKADEPHGAQLVTARLAIGEVIRLDPQEIAVHYDEVVARAKMVCAIRLWREIYSDELKDKLTAIEMSILREWRPGIDERQMREQFGEIRMMLADPTREDLGL